MNYVGIYTVMLHPVPGLPAKKDVLNLKCPHSPLRVLAVDSCPDTRESLALLLHLWGHEVETAPDGPAALAKADTFHPDVVILDVAMPGFDGWELARRLRRDPVQANVHLIVVSGFGREEDRQHSQEAGCEYHLLKPVDPTFLEGLLAKWQPENSVFSPSGDGLEE
jgi:CheY-like chemotaxis protein